MLLSNVFTGYVKMTLECEYLKYIHTLHTFRETSFQQFYCTLQIQTKLVTTSILKHPCELRQACLLQ